MMKNMTLENITAVCGGIYYGSKADKSKTIEGAVIDSRLVKKGFLFLPIKGARVDGHTFISEVFDKGALAVLSEYKLEQPKGPYILVDSTEDAMKKIAEFYRKSLNIKVVGITGSVGKTSTKEMIASVLSQRYNVFKTEGNFNNEIGVPLSIFQIREDHEAAVLEMGISDFGEMHRLAAMVQPDICVITNIGTCHLENLRTRDGVLKAKTESFEHLTEDGIAVLNGDDDKLCEKTVVNGRPSIFYGMGEDAAGKKSVYAANAEAVGLTGTRAVIHIKKSASETESFSVEIPIAGAHNVYNALAAAAVAGKLGLTTDEIKRGIESVQTITGRSHFICKGGITIIDDCYNANPMSMKAAIDVLSKASGRKIAVLGDMGELGADEKKLHYETGAYFEGKGIEWLYCTGELSKEIAAGVAEKSKETKVRHFATKEELAETLKREMKEGDTILVKASHFMDFPKIVKILQT